MFNLLKDRCCLGVYGMNRAHAPQILKTLHPEPVLHNKRSHRNEESSPLAATRESPRSEEDPVWPKINNLKKKRYLVWRKLEIDPLYISAGVLDVLMPSRAQKYVEKGKGGCPGWLRSPQRHKPSWSRRGCSQRDTAGP